MDDAAAIGQSGAGAIMMKQAGRCVVVSFAALDGDPYERVRETGSYVSRDLDDVAAWGPTLRAVADPRSDLFGRVSDWYYLCHPSTTENPKRITARSSREVAEDTRLAIDRHLPLEKRPRFHTPAWDTARPPHDHADIFRFVCRQLHEVRHAHPTAQVVLVLSSGTQAMHAALLLAGSTGVIDGPVRLVQVERREGARLRPSSPIVDVTLKVDTVLHVARETTPTLPGADRAPDPGYDQASSPALRGMLDQARRAASVPFPILLRGERGTGKSTLASFIRAWSPFRDPKKDRQWPSVACGQFPDPEILMVELCGSVEGAYTGVRKRAGLLALADGDTLFLDEIHDMSEANQRMVIRVLEEHRYYQVGSTTPSRSTFRLISGTNVSDGELQRRLCADFYDRIRDIELTVPPLRECREDLPWMWEAAWRRVAAAASVVPTLVDPHAGRIHEALAAHALPGNWRDLRRLAVQIAVMARDESKMSGVELSRLLDDFRAAQDGAGAWQSLTRSRLSKRDAGYLASLEQRLGPALSLLWEACNRGELPRAFLEAELGNRYRARRAADFISRVFPDEWSNVGEPQPSRGGQGGNWAHTVRPNGAQRRRKLVK